MRIKKTSQYIEGGASLSNVYGTSNENGYTQEYINGLETYSTDEVRIGTWIDGKPLYRITYIKDPLVYSNTSQDLVLFTLNNIDNITKIDAVLWNSARTMCHLMPYVNANSLASRIVYYPLGGRVAFNSADTWSNAKLILILEYTKTTD